jgi:hypothetical protein
VPLLFQACIRAWQLPGPVVGTCIPRAGEPPVRVCGAAVAVPQLSRGAGQLGWSPVVPYRVPHAGVSAISASLCPGSSNHGEYLKS